MHVFHRREGSLLKRTSDSFSFSLSDICDANVQGNPVDPCTEAAPIFEACITFPQVIDRFLIEVGYVFFLICIHQANLINDVLVLHQEVCKFFFLIHLFCLCFYSISRERPFKVTWKVFFVEIKWSSRYIQVIMMDNFPFC